ncbi:hypothetical protein PtA15_2A459 [Puccinia triticina]|uniref:Uncharacterized protein n=1 Tax=Puccinia triticina TaxID=208348 RepID=A0ABY7CE85_9BASI|nr:uncharacterized protein PtA15_2A459 [Puccinia triticina]WAQ82145.1 hypothetical protein PtA15_2A459 [Puccinia triticina]
MLLLSTSKSGAHMIGVRIKALNLILSFGAGHLMIIFGHGTADAQPWLWLS